MYYFYPQFISMQREGKLPKVTELYFVIPGFGKTVSLTITLSSLAQWTTHRGRNAARRNSTKEAVVGKKHQERWEDSHVKLHFTGPWPKGLLSPSSCATTSALKWYLVHSHLLIHPQYPHLAHGDVLFCFALIKMEVW